MTKVQFKFQRWLLIAVATLYIAMLLGIEHLQGGVVSHHVLQRDDMPAISNWWGLLLVPVLSWFLTGFMYQRVVTSYPTSLLAGFAAALLFGITLSMFFQAGQTQVLFYMMLSLPLFALLFPLYRAEYLLGFVLAMSYSFGAILPTAIGALVVLMSFVLHKTLRPLLWYLWSLLSRNTSS
jgi:hypothetical protein